MTCRERRALEDRYNDRHGWSDDLKSDVRPEETYDEIHGAFVWRRGRKGEDFGI